jgi:hypothetical protein
MSIAATPRFEKYKRRKRDNWTVQRLAQKFYGARIVWPIITGLIVIQVLFWGMIGSSIIARIGGISGTLTLLSFFLIPAIVLSFLDEGRGPGVFVGRLFWALPFHRDLKTNFITEAENQLARTDEELFDRFEKTRPQSSR